MLHGKALLTVESLAKGGDLHPVQQAMVEKHGSQCGFCTPGFVLMAGQLLEAHPNPDDDTIRHYLSGNLCRCGAHPRMIRAVQKAAAMLREGVAA